MLHEVKLLVRGGGPEILTVVGQVVCLLLPLLVGEAHGALLAERWIGQHVVEALTGIGHQRVIGRNRRSAVDLADVVEKHIHQAQAARVGDDLVAMKRLVLQERLLPLVEIEVVRVGDEVVGCQKEPAGSAGRIGDVLARLGAHAFHHAADESAWREILPCARLRVLGVPLQQTLVDVPLDVGAHRDPLGVIHHVDQAVQLRRVLDLVLRLGENLPSMPVLTPNSRSSVT